MIRKAPQKTRGGYANRKKGLKKSSKANELTEPIVIKKKKPLIPGIGEALKMMSILAQELKEMTKTPHTVSIDVIDDKWVLVVRGYQPPYDYYGGYRVMFIKSTFIRNPMANQNPMPPGELRTPNSKHW